MNALNSIIIEGNLVKAPELRKTEKGTSFCQFSVAVNRWYKQQNDEMAREVSFFDVTAWGQQAQQVAGKGSKGQGLRVVGRLKQDRWIDTSGKQCSRVVIIAEHVEFRAATKQDEDVPENDGNDEEKLTIDETQSEERPAVNW
jgi:single-strand DNA-binding protein